MPAKSPDPRIEELTEQLRKLEGTFETYRALAELRIKNLEESDAERARREAELQNTITELIAKIAVLEERARQQEKTSDRGWQLWVAVLGFAFGLINMIITGALQLKK